MKKKDTYKLLIILLVGVSLLLNVLFVGANFYGNLKKSIYRQASSDAISAVFAKAKQDGEVDLVYNGEQIKLTLSTDEES